MIIQPGGNSGLFSNCGGIMKRLTTKEAAAFLGYSPYTLRNWRQGYKTWRVGLNGPKFDSVHGRIYYLEEDLCTWMALSGTSMNEKIPQSTLEYCDTLA